MDFDNESLLKCFCSEEEEQAVIAWNKDNEHARSDVFEFSSAAVTLSPICCPASFA